MPKKTVSKKPSIALCGIGRWGKNLAHHFYQLGALSVICDRRPEFLKAASENFKNIKVESSYDNLLKDKSTDAIVIAVPTPEHYFFAKKALLASKHVFVEKPIALKVAHAEELCQIARQKKKKLMVGHLLLYHPALIKIKEIIRSNQLGELYYLYTQRLNLGQIRKDENAMWSLAPHDISILLELFPKKPIAVSADGYSYIQRSKGIEDVIFMHFDFADGKSAHIHLSWLDPHKVRRITLVGSKKMVVFDDMEQTEKLRVFDKGVDLQQSDSDSLASAMVLRVGDVEVPYIENIEPLRAECAHFIECIEKNMHPKSDGENGLEVLKILEAASQSLKLRGKKIKL